MFELNWWIGLMIGILITLTLTTLRDLYLTPYLRKRMERRAIIVWGKKIKNIKNEFEYVDKLHNNPPLLQYQVLLSIFITVKAIIQGFFAMTAIVLITSSTIYSEICKQIGMPRDLYWKHVSIILLFTSVLFVVLMPSLNLAEKVISDLICLRDYDDYKLNVENKLNELKKGSS